MIGDGFLHPWDNTISMARSQGSSPVPEDLSIEVPDRAGHWVTARNHLGIPAGRPKTVVFDLTGVFRKGAPRKLRLRTSKEVYWDGLAWAQGLSSEQVRTQRLSLSDAELRYRGFSLVTQASPSSPELAHYEILAVTGQQWRNLEGYYTRYGDVRELLEKIDNRIVIANSGDELRMRFAAVPPPAVGWTRDHVFIGDEWMKEGDYNLPILQDGAASALSRDEALYGALNVPRTGWRLSTASFRLAAVSYPLRDTRAIRKSVVESRHAVMAPSKWDGVCRTM